MNKHYQHISVSGCWRGEGSSGHLGSALGKVCEEWASLLKVSEQVLKDEEAFTDDGWVRDLGRGEGLHETQRCECMVHSKYQSKEFHMVEGGEMCNVWTRMMHFYAFLWYSS